MEIDVIGLNREFLGRGGRDEGENRIESVEDWVIRAVYHQSSNFLVALRARARAIIAGIINWSRSLLNLNAAGSGAKNNTVERFFLALLDARVQLFAR